MNKKSLIYSTSILTAVNVAVRLMGFAFRIWLSRQLGAEGMGLYQLVFPVFSVMITVVSSGLPVAVSKMVASKPGISSRITTIASRFILAISVPMILLCFIFASPISTYVIGDSRALMAFIIMLPSLLFVGLESCYKGYFYGVKNVHPPALSELFEQIVRILFVVIVFNLIPNPSSPVGAAIAMMGVMLGDLAGLICVRLFYRKRSCSAACDETMLVKQLFNSATPITTIRLTSTAVNSFTSIILPKRLVASGLAYSAALSQFGILMGMAFPLIHLPCTITSALAVVMVPNLAENLAANDRIAIKKKIYKAYRLTSVISFFSAPLVAAIAKPLGLLLFNQADVGHMLTILSPYIVIMGLQSISSSILNGINKQRTSMNNFLISSVFLVLCTLILTAIPSLRIYGYIIGLYLSGIICTVLNMISVFKSTGLPFPTMRLLVQPLVCSVITYFGATWLYSRLSLFIHNMLLNTVFTLLYGGTIFAVFALLIGLAGFDDK